MVVATAVKAVRTAEDRHIRSGGLQRVWQPSATVVDPTSESHPNSHPRSHGIVSPSRVHG